MSNIFLLPSVQSIVIYLQLLVSIDCCNLQEEDKVPLILPYLWDADLFLCIHNPQHVTRMVIFYPNSIIHHLSILSIYKYCISSPFCGCLINISLLQSKHKLSTSPNSNQTHPEIQKKRIGNKRRKERKKKTIPGNSNPNIIHEICLEMYV